MKLSEMSSCWGSIVCLIDRDSSNDTDKRERKIPTYLYPLIDIIVFVFMLSVRRDFDSILRWFSDVIDAHQHERRRQCQCPSRQILKLLNLRNRFVLNDLSISSKTQSVGLIVYPIFMSCHPTIQSLTVGSISIYCFVTFSSRYTSTYWTYGTRPRSSHSTCPKTWKVVECYRSYYRKRRRRT